MVQISEDSIVRVKFGVLISALFAIVTAAFYCATLLAGIRSDLAYYRQATWTWQMEEDSLNVIRDQDACFKLTRGEIHEVVRTIAEKNARLQ